jgi:hypothetical protein
MFILTTLKRVLFWSYERGTWQYDIMCVLILAFIFFSPNSLFRSQASRGAGEPWIYIASEEVDRPAPDQIKAELERRASAKMGHQVSIKRYELELDDSGNVKGYLVPRQSDIE